MKTITIIFLVSIVLVLGATRLVFALPPCPPDQGQYYDNCFGSRELPGGGQFIGEFRKNKKNGRGTYLFSNGTKYIGEVRDNQANGRGTYTRPNGDKYVGEFRDGKFHGQGAFVDSSGLQREGLWKNGQFLDSQDDAPRRTSQPRKSQRPNNPPAQNRTLSVSSGSGFAVSPDGHVVTNFHVIEGCQAVKIHHEGRSIQAAVVTVDPKNDLALLKANFVPPAVFSLSAKQPELLQDIYVAGYPFGREISTSVKVTKGIVSSLMGIGNNSSQLQIDAALQPGNSGGPILDETGDVIGVAVAKLDIKKAMESFGVIPEDTNFGIKTNVVRNVLEGHGISLPRSASSP